MKVELVEGLWSKWSFLASVFFTAVWGSLGVAWASIDAKTQEAILQDFGIGEMTMNKLVAYMLLLSAVSTGIVGGLRAIKQHAAQ